MTLSRPFQRLAISIAVVAQLSGCGISQEQQQRAEKSFRDRLEAELLDYIACAGLGSGAPIDLAALKALIQDPTRLNLENLFVQPDLLAEVIAMAGLSIEGSFILSRNLELLSLQGHLQRLLSDGWQPALCGAALPLACTSGSASSNISCDGTGNPQQIDLNFVDCFLRGNKYRGGVSIARVAGDDTIGAFTFDNLLIDDIDSITGAGTVQVASSPRLQLAINSSTPLEVRKHGGHTAATPSCAQTLSLATFVLSGDATGLAAEFTGSKRTHSETYSLQTFNQHLHWQTPFDCVCPGVDAGLTIGIPKPLSGDAAAQSLLHLSFGTGSGAAFCATPSLVAENWPTDCAALGSGDCGKLATEELLAAVLQLMCSAAP